MQLERQIEDLQALRASEWFEILKKGRPDDQVAFREWCRRSPQNIQEFLEISWADRELQDLDANREVDLEALLREVAPQVAPLPLATHRAYAVNAARSARWRWGVAAGLVACALVAGWYGRAWLTGQEFITKVGEQRTVELGDQSMMTLNTDSDVKIAFERDERNVQLRRGEAVFKVAHDPTRPFRVHTRAGVIQAIGTQFNVYDRAEGVDVAVLEGRVRLMPRDSDGSGTAVSEELAAGQEARIGLDGAIQRAKQADVERVVAWSKRRLKFDNAPLEEIVREFNRYHQNVKLRVEGAELGSRRYTGIFDADDPGTLARFLEKEGDLEIDRRDGEISIRPVQASPQ